MNRGKDSDEFQAVAAVVELHPADAAAAGVADGGRATIATALGRVTVRCRIRKPDELQPGVAFVAYSPLINQLTGGETHGTGMPDTKSLRVWLTAAEEGGSGGGEP